MAPLLVLLFFFCATSLAITPTSTGHRMELTRMHANGNMQRAAQSGSQFFSSSTNITTPLKIDLTIGQYLIKTTIGTPPITYEAVADTGSDLIWTQCAPCVQCQRHPKPMYHPSNSSSYAVLPCNSSLSLCQCPSRGCLYNYTYDKGWTSGIQSIETFTFGPSSAGRNNVVLPGLTFGCSNATSRSWPGSSGIVGLARGNLSLVSQLRASKFSYCLTSYDSPISSTSPLFVGPSANLATGSNGGGVIQSTPFVKTSHPLYYLPLLNISVGTTLLSIPPGTFSVRDNGNGKGGIIIDSGTTYTTLFDEAYQPIRRAISSLVTLPVANGSDTSLDLCFSLPSGSSPPSMPNMTFHFENADMVLPPQNYMRSIPTEGLWCLAMSNTSYLLRVSIFGNYQQQNTHFLYDLDNEMLSFVPVQCSTL